MSTEPLDDHDVLRRKLSWTGPRAEDGRFLSVYMDQNNKCNLRCRTCGFSDARTGAIPRYDIPAELFKRIVGEVFPRTNYLCLSIMTEPFMTREFPDRLRFVREAGVPFSDIITNGTLLNPRIYEQVFEARISRFTFSIDGGTKDVFELLRTGARFEHVMANVRLFQTMRPADGPRLRINHVLSEPNIDHFEAFLALMEEVRPEQLAVRTVSRMSDAVIQESRDAVFWSKVQRCREQLAAFVARTGIEDAGYLRGRPTRIDLFDERGETLVCQLPWTTIAIHPNGDVYPCMAWTRPPVGNLLRDSFDAIWNGDALAALRDEFVRTKAGVDCLNCTIRMAGDDPDDDFFYRKLAKPLPRGH
jgi:radical SAM protein with 4Fe4S-binding SPASM domain